jgi:hypothetical protein
VALITVSLFSRVEKKIRLVLVAGRADSPRRRFFESYLDRIEDIVAAMKSLQSTNLLCVGFAGRCPLALRSLLEALPLRCFGWDQRPASAAPRSSCRHVGETLRK